MPTALITGASAGLGRALGLALAGQGWRLIVDARVRDRLERVADEMRAHTDVVAVAGDISVREHQQALVDEVESAGGVDLQVNNASTLGPSPLRPLAGLTGADLRAILAINVEAPHALTRRLLPFLVRAGGVVLSLSSDAAVEHYPGWGGYGASKAALDHLTLTLAAENPEITAYAVDPGDMRTEMHQRAFPGEDISDRPYPETVVPELMQLLRSRPASGRYRVADLRAEARPVEPAGAVR